jgi:SAM-dependent methyltransferase
LTGGTRMVPLCAFMKFAVPKGTFSKSAFSERSPGIARHSSGFDQFQTLFKGAENLSVLDLSGVSQANITFVTEAGHRISSDDIVGAMLNAFGDHFESQETEAKATRFLEQTLRFPAESFDGALVWDAFQFLAPPLINKTVDRLLRVMRPGGLILAFFNANEKVQEIPLYSYRIQDAKTLLQVPRGVPQHVQNLNNRTIERLFEDAASVKFFLTRDNLREVLIRR